MEGFKPATMESLKALSNKSLTAFNLQKANLQSDRYRVDRPFVEIEPQLPTLHGQNLRWWLAERQRSITTSRKVRILDIGCGDGTTASQLESVKTEAYGITAYPYKPQALPSERITVGNISNLSHYFPREFFDIIYTYSVFEHIQRPVTNFINQIYKLLAPDGSAFLDLNYSQNNLVFDLQCLEQWLKANGFDFEFQRYFIDQNPSRILPCAFRKPDEGNDPRLLLPISYDISGHAHFDVVKSRQYEAEFNHKP